MELLLYLFLALVISIILIDVIPQFYTWQSRIKIGRFADTEIWKQKVTNKAQDWLNNTPTIKVTDNERLIIIDILKGKYKKNAIQSWQEAALLLGLTNHTNPNNNAKISQYIKTKIDQKGNWKNPPKELDSAILAFAIMNAQEENLLQNKPAFDYVYNLIKSLLGSDGTVAYRKYTTNYRFVDTVGFISPFLVKYGLSFGNDDALKLGLRQISKYIEIGFSANENLPCHTYDINSKNLVGLTGWGRGLAWFIIGLTDAWKSLPENSAEKANLEKEMVKNFENIIKFQDSDGSFHWLLTDKSSWKDSSVTSVLAWFFSECENIVELKAKAQVAKEKSLNYLKTVTRRNGAIDFSQGDTKAIGIYSQNFDILPFTQGFCLRALN